MKYISLFLCCFFLSSCALLEQPDPLPLYTLQSGSFEKVSVLKDSIALDKPLCEASINTHRIALTPSRYQRDYFADGSWPDHLPDVFYEALLDGLSQRWGGIYVNRLKAGVQAKYILRTEIQDFSIHTCENTQEEAHIKAVFKVVDLRERQIIASHVFEKKVPLYALTMEAIIGAFNQGTHALLEDVISWMEGDVLKSSKTQ